MPKHRNKRYDIFISYRRDGGSETAKHLRDSLTERGYRVFLDVESLRSGPFNRALYDVIDHCRDFLLILPPNGLDRCVDPQDWLRLEIERAAEKEKNIIPIRLKGFKFPETLPESVNFVRYQNGPSMTDIEYYDAYVDHLTGFFKARAHPKWRRLLIAAVAAACLALLGFGVYYSMTTYPLTARQRGVVSSMITYSTFNLAQADMAGSQYLKALDRAGQYIEGKTTDSLATLQVELTGYRDSIDGMIAQLTSLPGTLRQDLMNDGRFEVGELEAMKSALTLVMTEYSDHITKLRDDVLPNDAMRAEHRADYISFLKAWAELDGEMLFYTFNESLLPVTNDGALVTLKNEILPGFSFIYARRLDLTRDEAALKGKEEAIYRRYSQLLDDYLGSIEREESAYIDESFILTELERLRAIREEQGVDTSEAEARLEGILEKKRELEDLKRKYVQSSDDLKQARARLYEKFKPLEEDDASLLWGKGKRFLTCHMPAEAAECFAMCAEKGDPDFTLPAESAVKFAENCTALGLEGGVVVCAYEEGLPRQAVAQGDIIYEVDGASVRSFSEYGAAIEGDGTHAVRILRFGANGHELLEGVIDNSLGRIALLGLNDDQAAEADEQD